MSTDSSLLPESSPSEDYRPTAAVSVPPDNPSIDGPFLPVPEVPEGNKPTGDGSPRCGCSQKGRNLVVCIDGTANQFGEKNTNIVELYSRLVKDKTQLTYYNSGIGTYARPSWISYSYIKQLVHHMIDKAIAWNLERIVLSAYQWLSENYEEGDRIFLFGFSRGAYQTRVIAGMINKVGLLHKGNNDQIPFAYEFYMAATETSTRSNSREKLHGLPNFFHTRLPWFIHIVMVVICFLFYSAYGHHFGLTEVTRHIEIWYIYLVVQIACASFCAVHNLYSSRNGDDLKKANDHCDHFKRTLSRRNVRVHFVGAWDTVSSIGLTRGPSLPETTTGMTHVCHFRHALALDERRIKFMPEYANGGAGPGPREGKVEPGKEKAELGESKAGPDKGMVESGEGKRSGDKGDVKEVWFVGFHSDIGGGNVNNLGLKRFEASLRWGSYEGISHGLKMEPYKGEWVSIDPVESLTGIWILLELWPFRRLTYKDPDSTTYWPHFGNARIVQQGQLIHESVLKAIADTPKYQPRAQFYDGTDWNNLTRESSVVEPDPFTSNTELIRKFASIQCSEDLDAQINVLATFSNIRLRSVTEVPCAADKLLSALKTEHRWENRDPQRHRDVISVLCTALAVFPPQPRKERKYQKSQLREFTSVLRPLDKRHHELLLKIFQKFANPLLHGPFECHGDSIPRYCAFSLNGKCVFSGSKASWAIWEEGTDKPEWKSYGKYTGEVEHVAFSADGTRIATGLGDGMVLVWDSSTGKVVKGPLEGHTDSVCDIAFSPDGTRIASGSSDHTIRVWDVTTGEVIGSMEGHTDWVRCVTFSPNGTRIVSGSDDNTIRVWDVKTGKEVMGPLRGHTGWVWAVAYSPNGTRIASGSLDHTIQVWDAETGLEVMEPLEGHTSAVLVVAYSLDGRRVASGSADGTIRVWDTTTGKILGVLNVGSVVYSVAFSPDGKRIVSGSREGVHIWDAENPELWLD